MLRFAHFFLCAQVLAGCGGSVDDDSARGPAGSAYRRPFGPNAPWNVPVRGLPRHPESDVYAQRLWEGASRQPGNWNLTFDGYTYPVYYVDDATEQVPVRTRFRTNIDRTTIPWDAAWQPPHGTDAQIIIVDRDQGREWDL